MDDSKWERRAWWGGIVFVIFTIAGLVVPRNLPKPTDSGAKIAAFLTDQRDEVGVGAYLSAVAVVPLLWWLGSLWRLVVRAERGVPRLAVIAMGGGVFAAVMLSINAVVVASLPIIGVSTIGPVGAKTFYVLGTGLGISTAFGSAVLMAASSIAFIRSRMLPAWLGWTGVVVAIVAIPAGAAVSSADDVFVVGSFVAFGGYMLWTLALSILMLLGREREPGDAPAVTAPAPTT